MCQRSWKLLNFQLHFIRTAMCYLPATRCHCMFSWCPERKMISLIESKDFLPLTILSKKSTSTMTHLHPLLFIRPKHSLVLRRTTSLNALSVFSPNPWGTWIDSKPDSIRYVTLPSFSGCLRLTQSLPFQFCYSQWFALSLVARRPSPQLLKKYHVLRYKSPAEYLIFQKRLYFYLQQASRFTTFVHGWFKFYLFS